MKDAPVQPAKPTNDPVPPVVGMPAPDNIVHKRGEVLALEFTDDELIAAEIAISTHLHSGRKKKKRVAGDVMLDRKTVEVLAKIRGALPDAVLESLGLTRDAHGIVCEPAS